MSFRTSRLTMLLALLALAAFLGYWLLEEYKRELHAMQLSAELELATEIISDQHQDMEGMLKELERLGGNEKVGIVVGVTTDEIVQHHDLKEHDEDLVLRRVKRSIDDTSATMTVRYTDLSGFDTTIVKTSPLHDGAFKATFSKAALFGIWPQSLFAVCLFALFLVGIRLMMKNFRRERLLAVERSDLISNMTHELKTPVATIAVALEAIQDFNVQDDRKRTDQYLGTARKEIARLGDSIDMVMQLSKMEQGAEMYQKESIEPAVLLQEVLDLMQPQLESAGVEHELKAEEAGMISVDQHHFKNVMINLLDNAIKYGGQTVRIDVRRTASKVRIAVEDDGPGISAEYRKAVFDRFFRVPSNAHNVKGDGLGLSYVKAVVEAHGGSVQLIDQEKGTKFQISIPVSDG